MAFAEIAAKLKAAGYDEAFHDDDEVIDLHGLAIRGTRKATTTDLQIGTLLSQRTKEGLVELLINGERTQLTLDKAREVLGMLASAIEAAVSDQLIYAFLTQKIGLSEQQGSAALLDFRELRQGSRSTVYGH
jgi:phage tail sheath gpL-like